MPDCPYHLNGFEHLDVDLGGAEQGFDLGFKFERRDAREPFWVLYVTYHPTEPGPVSRGTLHFADSRPSDEAHSSAGELEDLFARAKPFIADALRGLKAGQPRQSRRDAPQYV